MTNLNVPAFGRAGRSAAAATAGDPLSPPGSNPARLSIGLLAVSFSWTLVGCEDWVSRTSPATSDTDRTPLPVAVVRPRPEPNAAQTVVCYGKLEPQRSTGLGFLRGGRVARVAVQVGDRVGRGDLLAELEQPTLQDQKTSIESSLARARELLAASGQSANRQTNTQTLQQQIRSLEQQLVSVNAELDQGVIAAPYDAIIVARSVDAGSMVSTGTTALRILEDAQPQVEVRLPQRTVAQLQSGGTIQVQLENSVYSAALQRIAPVEEITNSQTAWLGFTDELPRQRWHFGRVVTVECRTPTGDRGHWLPLSALHREAGELWSVLIASSDSRSGRPVAATKIVRVIRIKGDSALVQGSLGDRALVIAEGTHRIVSGQPIEVIDKPDPRVDQKPIRPTP